MCIDLYAYYIIIALASNYQREAQLGNMMLRREGIVSTISNSLVIVGVTGEGVFWKRELVFQASKFVITASLRAQSYCGLVIYM